MVQRRRPSFDHAIGPTPLDRRVSAGKQSAERAVRNDAQPVGIVRLNALAVPRLMINSYILNGRQLDRRPFVVCSGLRLGIILRHRVEGGRRPFASGAPARWGAHNSETLMQQPDHQLLVQESIPSRIAEALSVGAFRRSLSRRIAYRIGVSATNCGLTDLGQ